MPNYQKMYAIVCAAASDAVDCIRAGKAIHAEHTLLLALRRAEEMYLSGDEPEVLCMATCLPLSGAVPPEGAEG